MGSRRALLVDADPTCALISLLVDLIFIHEIE
jgi:hypothetical protein